MIWNNSSFTEHYRKIKIEGFQLDRLAGKCMKQNIRIKQLVFVSDLEITLAISYRDFRKLKKLAKSAYKITVLEDGGYRHHARMMWKKKITIAGILLFAAFLYYQNLFIAEIRVNGYEKIDEPHLRQTLAAAGLYEGCRKDVDLNKVKIKLYEEYDEITWAGIKFSGNMAEVSIAEGAKPVKTKVEKKKPCNIVADKAGYISKIIPIEGLRAADDGSYVKKGDILITGTVPLRNVAYGTESADKTETYVHAEGTVEAKIPKRLNFYAPRYERVRTGTGNKIWGISINDHNMAKALNSYEASQIKSQNLINIIRPFRLKIDLVSIEEVILTDREIQNSQLNRTINAQIRQYAKENLPKNAQILNKSLNFSREKNIITIGVTLETLQQIGIEEEIIVDKPDRKSKEGDNQRGD